MKLEKRNHNKTVMLNECDAGHVAGEWGGLGVVAMGTVGASGAC